MSLSARRSCTLPKPKPTGATPQTKQPFKPQYDEKYVQRFLGFWKQGKNDRKACLAFVKLHPTCDRLSCKSKPQTCTRHQDGISCSPCRTSRIKCPRLQAFLLDYVSVHLGVSSKTALDLYERYARERRGTQKEKQKLEEEAEKLRAREGGGDDDGDLSDPSLVEISSEEEDGESSDASHYRAAAKANSKGTPATNRSKGTPATTTTTKSVPPSSVRSTQDKDSPTANAAAAAIAQLQIATKRVHQLEADLSKLKKERNGMLEREKAYTLKAMAAASQPPPKPSLEEMVKVVEAELHKRKEIYRKEVMEEWDRLHQDEVERLRKDRGTLESCSATTITIPRTSVGLHMAVSGFVDTLAAEEGTSRVLDLLQWVTEFSHAVKEVDEDHKLTSIIYTHEPTMPKRVANFNENGEEWAKRRRLDSDAH